MNDQPVASLLRFDAFARRPEERLGLAEGGLLVAEAAYPTLDPRRYRRRLDALAAALRPELGLGRRRPNRTRMARTGLQPKCADTPLAQPQARLSAARRDGRRARHGRAVSDPAPGPARRIARPRALAPGAGRGFAGGG